MSSHSAAIDYGYEDAAHTGAHHFLLPVVKRILDSISPATIFDLGCGNGSVTACLSNNYAIRGIDISHSGISNAKAKYPDLNVFVGSVYDDLAGIYGTFDAVVSLEVVEHLYDPRLYTRNMFNLVNPGGVAIVSTPFHGYWKNLIMAVTGKLDKHFTALWDGGHIKFWSVKSMTALLTEAGFKDLDFHYVGRVPSLARSMIVVAKRSD